MNIIVLEDNALNFSLSKTVQTPGEGQFIIDGVSGNAAFEIFYQTDGKLEPAYIRGNKDVTDGVTIPADETEMTLSVDGVEYTIDEVSGDAKYNVLFEENGKNKDDLPRYVKLSSEDDDNIGLKHHRFSTVSMGLNSCCISQTKMQKKPLIGSKRQIRVIRGF